MNSRSLAEETACEPTLDDFDAVYEAYYQDVYRTVRGMVLDEAMAEDVTQNVFLKAYKGRSRYRPTGSLGGWLHRIGVNEAISTLRWHALQERVWATLQMRATRSSADSTIQDLLTQLLDQLNPGARAAVILHFLHGYRYREIAEILAIPEGTVATRIANGLRKMKLMLDNE